MPEGKPPILTSPAALGDLWTSLSDIFEVRGVPDPRESAKALICAAANCAPLSFITDPGRLVSSSMIAKLNEFAQRRLDREPVSRILGKREFWGLDLELNKFALDPRPDTERLVEACLAWVRGAGLTRPRILDIGVGAGPVLCALLSELTEATGVGIDLSADACRLAQRNIARLGLSRRSEVHCIGMTDFRSGGFDLVVSNPPYIRTEVIESLDEEVRNFDPLIALDGGEDGLYSYRSIISSYKQWVKDGGLCAVEIGYDQAGSLLALLVEAGLQGEVLKDAGGNDRVVTWGG